jgi:chorismate mutase/prephenate dehydrogenase
MTKLDELREQLNEVDAEFLRLVQQRQELVEEIGEVKRQMGRGTRDFSREKVVIERARTIAEQLGVDPDVAAGLFRRLIQASLTVQERDRLARRGGGNGRRVLVIGGAGRMGRWFVDFLDAQGYEVAIADPSVDASNQVEGFEAVDDWRTLDLDAFYMIVVAAPIRATNQVLEALAERKPAGIVLDISSIKEPVRPGLEALTDAGVSTTSIHPMFGPSTELLSGSHVVFIDLGDTDALEAARSLFDDTMASQVEMELEQHDRAMAFVLGLSHALNIVFGDTLATSGPHAKGLDELSSTTFARQVGVASEVLRENPHLYFEIQALNPYAHELLDVLGDSVQHLQEAVVDGDEDRFVEMMRWGRSFLADRLEISGDSEGRRYRKAPRRL